MLFANANFKFLPLPDQSFKWGDATDETLEAKTDEVGFTLFEPCGGFDCLSAKAAIVRLRHLPSQRDYTVVFSRSAIRAACSGSMSCGRMPAPIRSVPTDPTST